jgi:leucyl-tRNA synthetase
MSKSRGNVVNPDDVIKVHGADSLRLFLMFMGPLDRDKPWSATGIEGVHRFLDRVWRMFFDEEDRLHACLTDGPIDDDAQRALHKCIDQVSQMTEDLRFNTAISQMMIFTNEMNARQTRPRAALETFVLLLAPYAPHLAEELWSRLGHERSLICEPWPVADPKWLVSDTVTVVVQVNGKLRDQLEVAADADEAHVKELALASPKILQWTDGKQIVKVIYVPGKLVSVVVK